MQVEELPEYQTTYARGRRWSIAFHVLISSLSMLALVIMVNYLAHRHNQRLYISDAARQKLSPLTLRTLGELTNTVKLIVFFDRQEPLFGAVSALAKEYQTRSRHVALEFVDARMPGRAEAIRTQYKFQAEGDTSRVIFDSGGRVRTVLSTELSEYGFTPRKEVVRTGFRGEQLFTSAILNVTRNKPVTAYFLQGHGEQIPNDDNQGYSRLARLLENNNVTVRLAPSLVGTNILPVDCGLLIAAGPTKPIAMEELVKIHQYLANGGRMLALANINARVTPVGLEQLFQNWNVRIGFDWVHDPAQAQADDENVIVTSQFGVHPIVRSLARSSLGFIAPRSVSQLPEAQRAADAPKITELVFTSSEGYALSPADNKRNTVERRGAISLAVAGERGLAAGVPTERGPTRFVVAGDALFLSNAAFGFAANSDFAAPAINWLLNRDALLNEIGPAPISEYQILLTEPQMRKVRRLFLGVIPGAVMAFGFLVWLRRRV